MIIENKFNLGQIVYLLTDTDQAPHIVTGILVTADGGLRYYLACGREEYVAAEIEVSATRGVLPIV